VDFCCEDRRFFPRRVFFDEEAPDFCCASAGFPRRGSSRRRDLDAARARRGIHRLAIKRRLTCNNQISTPLTD